jgi:hypothetical protein
MKKMIFLIVGSILTLSVSTGYTQKAPEGFAGMKWGTPYSEFKKKDLIVERTINRFGDNLTNVQAKNPKVSDIEVSWLIFEFYKDRFTQVHISSYQECKNIFKKTLLEKYGKPTEGRILRNAFNAEIGEELNWIVEQVQISLYLNFAAETGILEYTYLPIWREYIKERDKSHSKVRDPL